MNSRVPEDLDLAMMLNDAVKGFPPPPGTKEAIRSTVMAHLTCQGALEKTPVSLRHWVRRHPGYRKIMWTASAAAFLVCLAMLWPVLQRQAAAASFEKAVHRAKEELLKTSISSFRASLRISVGGGEQVLHVWYKRPNLYREELPSGNVFVNDGRRFAAFNPKTRETMSTPPVSWDLGNTPPFIYVDEVMAGMKKGGATVQGPFSEEMDGIMCSRFDFTGANALKGSIWFSQADGLLLRMERKASASLASCVIVASYNVDVPDDLFLVPTYVKALPNFPKLFVTVLDGSGVPAADATVYVGNFAHCPLGADIYVTGSNGRVVIPLVAGEDTEQFWRKDKTGQLFTALGRLANCGIVAESKDRTSCDLFSTKDLVLFFDKGLMEVDPLVEDVSYDEKRTNFAIGPKEQFRYHRSSGDLFLRLRLMPKAAVTGRVVDKLGIPFTYGRYYVGVVCFPRPTEYVSYGKLGNLPKQRTKSGQVFHTWDMYYTRCEQDGTFRLDVPSGYPFRLHVQPLDVPPNVTGGFPANFPGNSEEPAVSLKPGEVRNMGDICVK